MRSELVSGAGATIGEHDNKTRGDNRIQTSIRVEKKLLQDFRAATAARGRNMNSVVSEMMQQRLDEWRHEHVDFAAAEFSPVTEATDDPDSYFRSLYLAWLPTTVVIRELRGRIIYADPDYHQLVGKASVSGHLPEDDWDREGAELMMERHELVRTEKKPILSAENAKIDGTPTPRLRLRFPIFEHGDVRCDVQAVGTLGLDLKMVQAAVSSINPKPGGPRTCKLGERRRRETVVPPQCPHSLIKDFISSLPLVAIIKNLEGKVACVNPAYEQIAGKQKEEVRDHLAVENWPGDPSAELIWYHDKLVQETKDPYISVEKIPSKRFGHPERVNIRFPIFDHKQQLIMTGCLGFDYFDVLRVLGQSEPDRSSYVRLRDMSSTEATAAL